MIVDIYMDVGRHLNLAPVTGSTRRDENRVTPQSAHDSNSNIERTVAAWVSEHLI